MINEKIFSDLGSGLGFSMGLFNFLKKNLKLEYNKMMGQCDKFLFYAIGFSEGAKKDLVPLLQNKKKILDRLLDIYRSTGKLDWSSIKVLKKLKKECIQLYNEHFNFMGKSFDEEYTPIRFKIDPTGDTEDY